MYKYAYSLHIYAMMKGNTYMKRIWACLLLLTLVPVFWPAPARAAVDREANKKIIFDYVINELNLNAAVACGILANVKAESNFDPEAVGDSGAAYGICQWNSRRDTMVKFCEDNGYGSWKNIHGQLAYLKYELGHYEKEVGAFLKTIPNTAQGAYDAAYHFCYYYEVPANRTTKSKQRGTNAVNTYWRDYYGGSVDTYTITYDANGGTNTPSPQTKTEGIPTLITLTEPVRTGYTFIGWSLNPDASTFDYIPYEEFCINRDTTLFAVWERKINDGTSPDASVTLNGHTYELYTGSYTWTAAESFAKNKGGYLATVETQEEYDAVKSLVSEADGDCWLGAKLDMGNWQWITGEAFKDSFASSKWAKGEPYALYGATERGRLAQRADGKWIDLHSTSYATEGFIVEYGSKTREVFPMYRLTVSKSLRLREGPGTTYSELGHLYTDEIVTITDVVPGTSYDWGWGYTAAGKKGWCAMKVPDYMVPIGGVDEETRLIITPHEEGCAVMGYQGNQESLVIPSHIQGSAVLAIYENAFASPDAPDTITLPAQVREVAPDSLKTGSRYLVPIGSDAHFAVSESAVAHGILYPESTLCPPDVLTEIWEDAFAGAGNVECVNLSETNVRLIGSGAFTGMTSLKYVHLPEGEITIQSGAFDLSENTLFIVKKDSPAEKWAVSSKANHLSYP